MNGKGGARKIPNAMHAVLGDEAEPILQDCENDAAHSDDDSSLLRRFSGRSSNRNCMPTEVDRTHVEFCLFSHIAGELGSGDLCIEGNDHD